MDIIMPSERLPSDVAQITDGEEMVSGMALNRGTQAKIYPGHTVGYKTIQHNYQGYVGISR